MLSGAGATNVMEDACEGFDIIYTCDGYVEERRRAKDIYQQHDITIFCVVGLHLFKDANC